MSDDLAGQKLLAGLPSVVRHLAVAHTAHHAGVVEALRTVVGVAEVLLEVGWWLVVAVRSVVQLHPRGCLVRNATPGLKKRNIEFPF